MTKGISESNGNPPAETIEALRSTRPFVPSRRVKEAATSPSIPARSPIHRSIRSTPSRSISSFFGENGSIEGGMIQTFDSSIHKGTKARSEKMYASQAVS